MKVHLMFENKDLTINDSPLIQETLKDEVTKTTLEDLEINKIILSMSEDDSLINKVCTFVLSNPLNNIEEIKYRQNILQDVLNNKDVVKALYKLCFDTSEEVRYSRYSLSSEWLSSIFSASVGLITIYMKRFSEFRKIASKNIKKFSSKGFTSLLNTIIDDFSDSYISQVQKFLLHMNEGEGTLVSCKFGSFLQGTSYTYRKDKNEKLNPLMRFAPSYTLPERDNISAEDLSYRRDKAINETTNILAKVAENFEKFFEYLKLELAFYVGCINLYDKLSSSNLSFTFPKLEENFSEVEFTDLYDISLALFLKNGIVTNDLKASSDKKLFIITGANQGGKTTYLRSLGQSIIMAQCGMMVAGNSYKSSIKNNIYTHFKKEEDNNMNSGKLDEEMNRMDKIVSLIKEGDLLLSNESFSSTNEREGSEIFNSITKALVLHNISLACVTHMYEYASSFKDTNYTLFLKAEHTKEEGVTYKIKEGDVEKTAFGKEIYNSIFKE